MCNKDLCVLYQSILIARRNKKWNEQTFWENSQVPIPNLHIKVYYIHLNKNHKTLSITRFIRISEHGTALMSVIL
jgi:hypothetical protein